MFPLEKSIFFKIDFNYSMIANCCLFFGDTFLSFFFLFYDAAWKSLEVRLNKLQEGYELFLDLILRETPTTL